ncbi:MAG TPA: FAD-dependent oxidoreductase [Thauera sp.]|nr:FAD-dependent oxidoreductase [Thauera sp.]
MSQGKIKVASGRKTDADSYEAGAVPIERSVWSLDHTPPAHPQLAADLEADIVVVGAGVVGASLSLHLAERGLNTVLIDAAQPADAASGRNAGHVQPYLLSLDPLDALPGKGRPFMDCLIENRNIVFDLCARHAIDADQVQSGLLELARKKSAELESKAQRWTKLGLDVEILGSDRLRPLVGTDRYSFGTLWRDGGCVNPFLLTNGMVNAAIALGARVYGDSPALACERHKGRWKLRTEFGSVLADRVVLCTNGHVGEGFYSELERTQFPLLACGLATRPLPQSLLDVINPTRAALSQHPAGLYPMVVDRKGRLITATIPAVGRAHRSDIHFNYFLRHLRRVYPGARDVGIELETYWTGMTHNSSPAYEKAYPKFYRMDEGVFALMNFGSWGNQLGPMMGMNVAQALAADQPDSTVLGCERPVEVRFPGLFSTKLRRFLIPAARLADQFNLV